MLFSSFFTLRGIRAGGTTHTAAAFLTILLLAGCQAKSEGEGGRTAPPEVGVIAIAPRPVTIITELPGRTAPYLIAEVRPQVAGIVLERLFQEGGEVTEGMPLYQIDPDLYRARADSASAALQKARANVEAAEARVARYKEMLKSKSVGVQDYDDAVAAARQTAAEVAIAEAELERAAIELKRTVVRSPITGRIGKSNVTKGALVTASQPEPLTTVQRLDPMYVDVTQPSVDYMRLRRELESGLFQRTDGPAEQVDLILEDGAVYSRKGIMEFSDTTVNQTTGSITMRIRFDNPNYELLPNLYVRARLQTAQQERGITVPQRCVARDPDGRAYVLVVGEGGVVEKRFITAPRTLVNAWLVTQGLSPGENVVVDGFQNIIFSEGAAPPVVTPVNVSLPQEPAPSGKQ